MVVISLWDGQEIELAVESSRGDGEQKLNEAILELDDNQVALDLSLLKRGVLRIRKPFPESFESTKSSVKTLEKLETFSDDEEDLDNVKEAKEGETFQDLYTTGEALGKGSFSDVVLATHNESNMNFAAKVIDREDMKRKGAKDTLELEINNMKLLKECPQICRIQDAFVGDSICHIVFELLPGGELFSCIIEKGSFSEREARDASISILNGLEFMHSKRVVHRDVKPENLMLKDKNKISSVKLSDFGFSKYLENKNACRTLCGTPGYLAPEILERWPAYDVECDMFSFGVILFLLLGGYLPFDPNSSNDTNAIFERTRNGDHKFYPTRWNNISPSAKELVAQCLSIKPTKRITAKKALNHQWMKEKVAGNKVDASALKSVVADNQLGKKGDELKDDFQGYLENKRKDSMTSYMTGQKSVATAATAFKEEGSSGRPVDAFYEKRHKLGQGAFAIVHSCFHQSTGKSYAIKEIDLSGLNDKELIMLQGEINAMKYVRGGPSIIRLYDVFRFPDKLHLVLEEMKGGDVLHRIAEKEVYTEAEARDTCTYFFEAVRYCHRKNIAHRDIKLDNLLLVEKNDIATVKLADFGFAKKCGRKGVKTMCGTPNYMAPEVFRLPESGFYDFRCDMWSVGVSVYCMLAGYLPFEGSMKDVQRRVLKGKYKFHSEYWAGISSSAKDMVTGLLQRDPGKRLSADDALQCEWMGTAAEALAARDLSGAQKQIKKNKFKKAAMGIMKLNKIHKFNESSKMLDFGTLAMGINQAARMEMLQEQQDAEEEKFDQAFELLQQIGEGEFGDLYIAINLKTKTEAAVKKVCRRKLVESDVVALDDEIAALRTLQGSKHIVTLLDVYEDADYTHIVMERVYGSTLIEQLVAKKRYTEFDAKEVVRNLLLGVHHCHNNRIAIRNLKLESLLLPENEPNNVKISDFESAKVVSFPNSLHTQCGTQEYVAPEILSSHPAYDVSCDMWTVGVIIFIMLGGYYPFRAKKEADVLKKIRYGEFKFHSKYWKIISDEAKDIIKRMLNVNPDERITAADALSSPWIHSGDKHTADLSNNMSELSEELGKRTLKGTARMVMALKRLNI
ncbi:unnamed protein product [Cylindrotheca closterium]|uniref:Protein kinase domain-containing protein n=1 Tax=Cylindrotheca closterium TaxID=2856 RepID=A0AAD2CSB7_9STRA|nr:unnamed protein product [Cylindrotheca closterium]